MSDNLIVTNNVQLASQNGNTVAISLDTHLGLWSLPLVGHLAMSDGLLFIGSGSGTSAYSISAVPEPSSLLPVILAASRLPGRRRRRL